MAIVIGLLTFILVLTSLFLILLVLVQLPKKEAGVGMAFGAGMSEMLLGAGSGNVLTRITKYTVGTYLVLSMILSVLISGQARKSGLAVTRAIEEKARATPAATPSNLTPGAPSTETPPSGSGLQSLAVSNLLATPAEADTNAGASPLVTTTTVVNPTPAPAPAADTNSAPNEN